MRKASFAAELHIDVPEVAVIDIPALVMLLGPDKASSPSTVLL